MAPKKEHRKSSRYRRRIAEANPARRLWLRLVQHAGKGLREGVNVARPSRRNVMAIADHESRRLVVHGIACETRGLAPIEWIIAGDVAKIVRTRQRARHLLLHRHKTL